MKILDIQVGEVYRNRGAGRTHRTVLAIGDEHRPDNWLGDPDKKPDEPGVLYEQGGQKYALYLSSFAQWARRM